jgi:7,8-dihydropterin-6-yl-methyl-4-(beta-D-ribofuranosyl)aminobenzene 5'-phosphate synthase
MDTVEITVLVDDTVHAPRLRAEHGLSLLVECDAGRLLYDTGASALFLGNAKHLGVSLNGLDGVVLSHNHYDHTGGVEHLVERFDRAPPVYAHPEVFRQSYAPAREGGGGRRAIGFPYARGLSDLERRGLALLGNREHRQILPGVHLSGEIPRRCSFEDTGGRFYRDPGLEVPDPVGEDQCLVLESAPGLVVVLGCCHSGLINTLEQVRALLPGRPLHAVVGGLHLLHASTERVRRTIAFLRREAPALIAAGHCTGLQALCALKAAFGDKADSLSVGRKLRLPA